MDFAFPQYLWSFFLLLILALVLLRINRSNKALILRSFDRSNLSFYKPSLKYILRVITLICICFALVGPYTSYPIFSSPSPNRSIYFLIDVSASMNAQDIEPSRFEESKRIIKETIKKLKGQQIGILAFTNYAYTQCPLTYDSDMALLMLDILETNQFANTGTNFRKALVATTIRFEMDKMEEEGEGSRCIILFTDGENFGETYQSVVNRMHKQGVSIIPVGIGTETGAQIPDIQADGKSMIKDKEGEIVRTYLDKSNLIELGKQFNTEPVFIDRTGTSANVLVDKINQLPYSPVLNENSKGDANFYQIFLILGILCFATSFFLMPQKKIIN